MNLATFNPASATRTEKEDAQLALKDAKFYTGSIDGAWGVLSKAALANWKGRRPRKAKASSFADPADLARFRKCKADGNSDNFCYGVGDNGEGVWGANTAQEHTPMVALHADDMKATWGSVGAAAHQPVVVVINGKTINATVEDRCGVRDRCDCNPAVAKLAGLKPPFLVDCTWAPA